MRRLRTLFMALLLAGATVLPMAVAQAEAPTPPADPPASDTNTDDASNKGFRLQITVK